MEKQTVYVVVEEYVDEDNNNADIVGVYLNPDNAESVRKELSKKYRWYYYKVVETQIKG